MIDAIHSYLVRAGKHLDPQPEIVGTSIPLNGSLFAMLANVFERSSHECEIDVVFSPDDDGAQHNCCRDALVGYLLDPSIENGQLLAARLQAVTTNKSGLGLLFLMKGTDGDDQTMVISRFPADQGVVVQEDRHNLSVQFIEQIFLKNSRAYKSAIYRSDSATRGFWQGKAVDRQISGAKELSDYWIRDFLSSDLLGTGPAATRRLAVALKKAIKMAPDVATQHELVSAATLMKSRDGQILSINQLVTAIGLSETASTALQEALPRPDLMAEVFQFDRGEFDRHIIYRAVELDSGALMIADDERFDELFLETPITGAPGRARYVTEGCAVHETLKRTR